MTLYFGWDVSTVVLGMCCLDDSENVVAIDHVVLDGEEDHRLRWLLARRAVKDFYASCTEGYEVEAMHFVEQRLKNMGGMTTKDTLLALGAINTIVSGVIMEIVHWDTSRLHHPYPVTTQKWSGLSIPKGTPSEDRKDLHVEFAAESSKRAGLFTERNKTDTGYRRGMDDRADAYIAALAGLRMAKADSLPDAIPRKKKKPAKKGAGKPRVRKAGKE